jgi:4-diphosphocytidyl-2-C-methyl-D-erythritol kinase
MLTFPNAKINLGLFVTEKRSDGFHNIETILFPIPLFDALEVVTKSPCRAEQNPSTSHGTNSVETSVGESFDLHIHGFSINGNPKENLVYKACELLKKDFPNLPNIRVDLFKKIPFGAGLGGGSADATFMLKLLNEKFSLNISNENLENYARQIGSDCACFVKNKPVFAYEKGDVFEPIELDLSDYQLLLVCPPIHVNTKAAYQNIVPCVGSLRAIPLHEIPVCEWKTVLRNDFETSVFAQHPILSDIKQKLYDVGAEFASMSGSGSAMFGLFPIGALHATPLQDIHNFLQIAFKDCAVFCLDL